MKKLTLSVVAAGLTAASLGAYAAVPTGAAPFQVVVPNLKSGLEFTLQGLYLQPSNSDLTYTTTQTHTTSGTAYSTHSVKPSYNFGFGVGLGYVFPNSGNDMQVNWTHFDHDSTDSTKFDVVRPGDNVSKSSNAAFKYDAVDLDMGQYLSMGTRLQTRLFAGLRFAQVKSDVTNTYNNVQPFFEDNSTEVGSMNSKFTGIGPRFGLDTSYHVGNCFGVVAHFATALLVGKIDSNMTSVYTDKTTTPATVNTNSVSADKQTRVVPAFDAKLGVDYTVPFRNDSSRMVIEAGYQVTQYVNAVERFKSPYDISPVVSSVGFNGPYLSLNFKM